MEHLWQKEEKKENKIESLTSVRIKYKLNYENGTIELTTTDGMKLYVDAKRFDKINVGDHINIYLEVVK